MAKTEMTLSRVESELKSKAEETFGALGRSATVVFTLSYTQVGLQRGLPFEVGLPNPKTVETLSEAEAGADLTEHSTCEDLEEWCNDCQDG